MEVVKKALEVMERRGRAYIFIYSDRTVIADPDAEAIIELPPTSQMEAYRSLVAKAPFVKMKDNIIMVSKRPEKDLGDFRGL